MTRVSCPLCGVESPARSGDMVWLRCVACHAMVFRQSDGPRVIVAHESDPIAQQIGVVLIDTGFMPIRVTSGSDALRLIQREHPAAIVLDVALTGSMSFQIIEQVRSSAAFDDLKIVLVASVFNRTAYKRRPISLYGADDYVEQHHIHDFLPQKLARLLNRPIVEAKRPLARARQRIRDGDARTDLAGEERVRALSRSIAADIALYHEAEVQAYRHSGSIEPIEKALDEGRRLLCEMVDVEEFAGEDPVLDAFCALVRGMERGTV